MLYKSTRTEKSAEFSAAYVIKNGLAEDGGLYVPETIPQITPEEINSLCKMDYAHRAANILSKFLTDYTYEELLEDCATAYSETNFPGGAAPLHCLSGNQILLELWHGPTAAFKDMALQIMPRLLSRALVKTGERRIAYILVATSGDTGKAALEGYKDVPNTKITVWCVNMRKILALFMAILVCASVFSGCGGSEEPKNEPENKPAETPAPSVKGEVFDAGNVTALVPEGWMGFGVNDVFAEESDTKDPDVIQICKNATSDWDIFTNPYVQINYYGPEVEFFPPSSDWYTDVKEVKSFKAGNHEWEGFTGYSDEYLFAILWCVEGDNEYQATMWLTAENDSINYDDEDVKAILASVAPSDGSASVGETGFDENSADQFIYERYVGDWNGVLKIYDCTGDYTSLENVVTGACARIVPDENGELFIFLGLYLEGFYITSAYYDINYASESIFISGDYNVGSYENVEILEYNPGTIGMTFPVEQENGSFYFTVNLRRVGDENWTNEDPKFGQADIDYFRGKTFEDIALMMGYSSNQYPPAELFNNVPSGSSSSALGEKNGADGIVPDYEGLKTGLEWCKTERTYDTLYDEIAGQFGVHGYFVDEYEAFDKPFRRYRWFYDDSNYVTITFEVKPDGSETWNATAWEGIKD